MLRTYSHVFSYLIVLEAHVPVVNVSSSLGWRVNAGQNVAEMRKILLSNRNRRTFHASSVLHGRALSSAVMAQQSSDLALEKVQVQVVDHCSLLELFGQAFQRDAYWQVAGLFLRVLVFDY